MGIVQEFKEFAVKGNVLDMAVGLIIGAEFGKIVNSLVNDVIMPPIGVLIGGVDFKNLVIPLKYADDNTVAVGIKIGSFLNSVITFAIIAFAVFMIVKAFNKFRVQHPDQVPPKA
jgi:large conductance mechanosensitive channel